ncbi:MAG: uracil-DNA glycosylase family protein [Chloroflexota bacterium]|nr:uracil-DNA glycosylase family protein [Chloroflexota bacterium]
MSRIFINYRRQDSEGYVGRLYDHLANFFPRDDIFMDIEALLPGVDFVEALEKAVASCEIFLAVIGTQWLEMTDDSGARRLEQWNDFVRIEIALALKHKKLVIPVLIGGAKMPAPDRLPDDITALARRNSFEISHKRFAYDVESLVTSIQRAIPARTLKATTSPDVERRKESALKDVRDDLVNAITSPLYKYRIDSRYFPVLGEGNADAKIMLIGQSPAEDDAEQGRPFVSESGKLLDEMLGTINLKRQDIYLTNLLLDRTPENRPPTPDELAYYAPFVDRIIDIVQPAVIAPMGKFAMEYMLRKLGVAEKDERISRIHGKLIKTRLDYGEIHVLPLYHPAVVLYTPTQKDTLRKDFQQLKLFI